MRACVCALSVCRHAQPSWVWDAQGAAEVRDSRARCEPLPRCGLSATRAEGRGAHLTHGLGACARGWGRVGGQWGAWDALRGQSRLELMRRLLGVVEEVCAPFFGLRMDCPG
eukprot:COSAG01_NODE_676_length_14324_cov_17.420105_17_plen_112_part_00